MNVRLFILIYFTSFSLLAQKQTNGEVIYSVSFDKNIIKEQLKKAPDDRKTRKMIQRYLQQTSDVNAVLKFVDNKSYYEVVQGLDEKGKLNLSFIRAGKKKKYFNDLTKDELFVQDCELLGECFRIIIPKINWTLKSSKKLIEGQMCYLAIGEIIVNNKKKEVLAWYNPSIPFNFGPKEYRGLPGLIMELQEENGKVTFKAKKIKLNTNNIKLKDLSEGRKVTEKEFKNLAKKYFPKELFEKKK